MLAKSRAYGHPANTAAEGSGQRDRSGDWRGGGNRRGQRAFGVLALAVGCLTAGCSSTPKWLETRAVCTLDGKEAHVLSKWGPVSLGSKLADADAKAICE
jgi:hypothetical protein